MMSCASCGQAIPPGESDLPCPRCGSVDRNVAMADYGTAVDEVTGLDARFPPASAAWQEMWAEVRHHLDNASPSSSAATTSQITSRKIQLHPSQRGHK